MEFYNKINSTVERDELIAGVEHWRLENVSIKGGAAFSRGCILGGASGIFEPVKTSADSEKVLVIAAEDFISEGTETKVATAYTSGNFTLEKLSTGSSVVSAADFKEPLRQVGILQTSMHEVY